MEKIKPSVEKGQALKTLLTQAGGVESGEEYLSQLIRVSAEKLIQEALEAEQTEYLGRERYERHGLGKRYRNGYEAGTLRSGEGILKVKLPQVRGGEEPYRSKLWQNLAQTSETLKSLIVEMYTLGMSQRDIEAALEKTFGQFVWSKSAVSEITQRLADDYEGFKKRDLKGFEVAYLFVDAVYEPLRRYGSKTGILCAWGICVDGSKVLLDLTLARNESFEACLEFLQGMLRRGLPTPLTITTDGAAGLIKAVESTWPRSKRIRCWFHKMRNLQQKVPPQVWPEFKTLVTDMRDAPSFAEGQRRLDALVTLYTDLYPEACRCLQDDAEASLNHLWVPTRHRPLVRTTNLVERTFVEERRRTKTIPHLWEESSLTQLVFAVLIRVSERWATPQFSELEQHAIRKLRTELHLEFPQPQTEGAPQKIRRSASRSA